MCTVAGGFRSRRTWFGQRGCDSYREFAGRFGGGALRSLVSAECFYSAGIPFADRAQPDRGTGSEDERCPASVLASGGARPMPGFLPGASEGRGNDVLLH